MTPARWRIARCSIPCGSEEFGRGWIRDWARPRAGRCRWGRFLLLLRQLHDQEYQGKNFALMSFSPLCPWLILAMPAIHERALVLWIMSIPSADRRSRLRSRPPSSMPWLPGIRMAFKAKHGHHPSIAQSPTSIGLLPHASLTGCTTVAVRGILNPVPATSMASPPVRRCRQMLRRSFLSPHPMSSKKQPIRRSP